MIDTAMDALRTTVTVAAQTQAPVTPAVEPERCAGFRLTNSDGAVVTIRRTPDAGRRTPDAGRRTPDAGRRTSVFSTEPRWPASLPA